MKKIESFHGEMKAPNGYPFVNCHIIFDFKIENFNRKACLVAGGHLAHTQDISTYFSVVTSETVHTALLMAAFSDLEVKAADMSNAYVTAPNREKLWTALCPEFKDNADKSAIIVGVLYGLQSTGASFKAHLVKCMLESG